MARIVVIHGMNQHYQSELELQERCRHALRSGCLAAHRAGTKQDVSVPAHDTIELVYYADRFRTAPKEPPSKEPRPQLRGVKTDSTASPEDEALSDGEAQVLLDLYAS